MNRHQNCDSDPFEKIDKTDNLKRFKLKKTINVWETSM